MGNEQTAARRVKKYRGVNYVVHRGSAFGRADEWFITVAFERDSNTGRLSAFCFLAAHAVRPIAVVLLHGYGMANELGTVHHAHDETAVAITVSLDSLQLETVDRDECGTSDDTDTDSNTNEMTDNNRASFKHGLQRRLKDIMNAKWPEISDHCGYV